MRFWPLIVYAGPVLAKALPGKGDIETAIKTENLLNTLSNLNAIAKRNGGNRAFGTPGYEASVAYVLDRVQHRHSSRLITQVQRFKHLVEETRSISLTYANGEAVSVSSPRFNVATPPGGITAELVATPLNEDQGSGCLPDHWDGLEVKGRIALVTRGVCPVAEKVVLAKENGALAVIVYEEDSEALEDGTIAAASLGADSLGKMLPVALVGFETGNSWRERLVGGDVLKVRLFVDAMAEMQLSWNVIVDTKVGDPDNIVMLGAHLDTAPGTVGINDNGSGVAVLLEVATLFERYSRYKNRVRFAFWGGEERGCLGSQAYAMNLTKEEASKIRFYFNYDMIASKNPTYRVFAENGVDKVGGSLLLAFLKGRGVDAKYAERDPVSDNMVLRHLGIPTAGIFTGASDSEDQCYHTACDDMSNLDLDALTLNTQAAAYAAAALAHDLQLVPPRKQKAVTKLNEDEDDATV